MIYLWVFNLLEPKIPLASSLSAFAVLCDPQFRQHWLWVRKSEPYAGSATLLNFSWLFYTDNLNQAMKDPILKSHSMLSYWNMVLSDARGDSLQAWVGRVLYIDSLCRCYEMHGFPADLSFIQKEKNAERFKLQWGRASRGPLSMDAARLQIAPVLCQGSWPFITRETQVLRLSLRAVFWGCLLFSCRKQKDESSINLIVMSVDGCWWVLMGVDECWWALIHIS